MLEGIMKRIHGKSRRLIIANERGVALVVAVLVMITATFLGIAAVMTSDIETRISGNHRVMEKAFYGADAGADRGLAWLINLGPTVPDKSSLPTMSTTIHSHDSHTNSRYRITDVNYKSLPPPGWDLTLFEKRYYRINSLGTFAVGSNSSNREIEVIASYVFPK
jgi:hypothetical protein